MKFCKTSKKIGFPLRVQCLDTQTLNLIKQLVEESLAHLISEVYDNEGDVGHARFLEVSAAGVLIVELLGPVLIRPLWHLKHKQITQQLMEEIYSGYLSTELHIYFLLQCCPTLSS